MTWTADIIAAIAAGIVSIIGAIGLAIKRSRQQKDIIKSAKELEKTYRKLKTTVKKIKD